MDASLYAAALDFFVDMGNQQISRNEKSGWAVFVHSSGGYLRGQHVEHPKKVKRNKGTISRAHCVGRRKHPIHIEPCTAYSENAMNTTQTAHTTQRIHMARYCTDGWIAMM
jgi:hypothetical protein